ncbi:MAG: TAXI family TRAP transporter solute-binding subunit [Synergistaceae bacterium]|jgi:TRAP transporter TAXI family solute receptor|nr:TAXI family TRAP transporter solute-binding subunit [Synergistaceae bacterium]
MSKKFFVLSVIVFCLFTAVSPVSAADQIFINIATGGTGGTYYPLGGAFADIWNNNIPGVNATVQTTGGSVANINLLKTGEVEMAIAQNDVCYYAKEGIVLFPNGKFPDLKGVASLYSEPIQLVTQASANISSVKDLKGKKVAIGAIGSGSEACARQVLKAAGIDADKDIDAKFLSFNEAATAMKDRQIDATFVLVGVPTAAIVDLATTNEIKLTPVDEDVIENLFKNYSYYVRFTIPANTYRGQTKDIQSVAVRSIIAVKADFDADLLYKMLETMYANKQRIINSHAAGKFIIEETALEGMSIELHPGAQKFFKDKGVIK